MPETVGSDIGSALDNANARMAGFCKEHHCPLYEELKDLIYPTPADAADSAYEDSVDTWIGNHMQEIHDDLIDDYNVLINNMVAISSAFIDALDESTDES